jgi:hypothetical protein
MNAASPASDAAPRVVDNVRMWTAGVPVEDAARVQIANLARLPILGGPIAIMPDVHLGKGATVGSVIPTRGAIIPAAVGVDIGCGMVALRTTLVANDLPDSLAPIRAAIERDVPVGFHAHPRPAPDRPVIRGLVLVSRPVAGVVDVDFQHFRLPRPAQLALGEKPVEHGRKQRQDVDADGGIIQ